MGRSKRNYDHLVDKQGNYGIDVIRGIFPGSDGNNLKGDKGEKGEKGQTGSQGPKGALGSTGPSGLDGGNGAKGDKGEVGPPLEFDQLTAGQQLLIKGQKGEDGQKGDIHTAPMLNFVGNAANLITLPSPANDFDTVYVESEDRYYTYYDGNWAVGGSPVKGEKGFQGPKGEKGLDGSAGNDGAKGEPGDPGLDGSIGLKGDDGKSAYEVAYDLDNTIGSEQDWVDSLKGEKGQDGVSAGGDPFDNSNYYDKSAIDQLINGHEVPERAFNYYFHGEKPDNIFDSGFVNFLSNDRFDHLYDAGCILIDGASILPNDGRPPFDVATKMLIINYVLNDPMGSRSELYNVLQFAYAVTNDGKFEGFVRRVEPHQNQFLEWQVCAFDPETYYTKTEVNSLINAVQTPKDYIIRPDAIPGAPSSAKVTLSGRNASGPDDTSVILQGENGINVYRDGDSIVIDGDRLNGIEYVGPISPSDDPYTKRPTAEIGDFFIYSQPGAAWNGTTVNTGDWVIFGPPVTSGSGTNEWSIIFVGAPQGVMSVSANEPLEIAGTDENPIVYLDPDLYFKNEDLSETLKPYAQWRDLFDVSRLRTLGSLFDVEVGEGNMGPGGIYNNQLSAIPVTPMTAGSYYLDIAGGGRLVFAQNDATVSPFLEAYNGTIPEDSVIRVISNDLSFHVESKVLTKDFDGLNYSYTFENPLLIQTLAFNPGSSFTMRLAFGYDTPDGSFLKWQDDIGKWVPSEHDFITDTAATEKFLLRRTGSSLLRADLIQMQDYNGGDTRIWLSGEVDVRGDKGELSCKKLLVSENAYVGSAVSPFMATLPNAVVTKARMDKAFDDYVPPFVDHPAFHGQFQQVQLEDLLVFNFNGPTAEFRTTGRDLKSFDFTVASSTEPRGLKKILSINQNRANFMGLTLTNIDNPQGPRDAVPLEFIDGRFLRTDLRDQLQTCRSSILELYQDLFEVRAADGTKRFVVDGGGISLENPKSTRAANDLNDIKAQELMGSWYTDYRTSQLETLLTSQIRTKTEEAPRNGKQYARKDGQWSEVVAPTGGGGGTTSGVEEAPISGGPYVRKNRQWIEQETSTIDAGATLPPNPSRGAIYLTSGNVLAIGL